MLNKTRIPIGKNKSNISPDDFIVFVLIVCFTIGTTTHLIDVFRLGFLGYSSWPRMNVWRNVFWTSLLFIDPIVVVLLFVKRRVGAVIGFVVLLADVLINYRYFSTILGLNVSELNGFSLQAACLLFSAATLPKLLSTSVKNKRVARHTAFLFANIPIPVLGIGLAIHAKGLISLFTSTMTLWELWVHIFMIGFDAVLLYMIVKKIKIGFLLGMAAFGLFGLIQATYAVGSFISPMIPFTVEMGLYLSVCCLMIAALLEKQARAYPQTSTVF